MPVTKDKEESLYGVAGLEGKDLYVNIIWPVHTYNSAVDDISVKETPQLWALSVFLCLALTYSLSTIQGSVFKRYRHVRC